MRIYTRIGFAALTLCLATSTPASAEAIATPSPSPTSTAEATVGSEAAGKHCLIVLEKLKPGEKTSRVASETCSDAKEDLHINAGILIWQGYEHINYGGSSISVEGDYGPCDAWGYRIPLPGQWLNRISSFRTFNNCDGQSLGWGFDRAYYYGYETSYVGNVANDKATSVHVWDHGA